MAGEWLHSLQVRFAPAQVEDVFLGTPLEQIAREKGFGLYVVRSAVPAAEHGRWHRALEQAVLKLTEDKGERAVLIKGKRRWYSSVQALTTHCTCTYEYSGTGRNPVYRVNDIQVLGETTAWLHKGRDAEDATLFNQIVANIYSRELGEYTPWHSDENSLLSEDTEIVSLSLGAPGIYCFCPNPLTKDLGATWPKQRPAALAASLRGCGPLMPGDVLITTGSFHKFLQHKTVAYTAIRPPVSVSRPLCTLRGPAF